MWKPSVSGLSPRVLFRASLADITSDVTTFSLRVLKSR